MGGAPSESRTTGAPAPSRELLDLHRAVIALPPTLQRTVLLYYAHCCTLAGLDRQALDPEVAAAHRAITIPAIAEILNCEQRTIYNRLHSAHTQILVLLRQFDAARRPLHPRSRRAGLGSVRQVRSPRGP
jgi:DNA-directed RNA polymerase specialized sigma24 family protein